MLHHRDVLFSPIDDDLPLDKSPPVFLGVWVDGSEDMPLHDQSQETDEDVGFDSLFRVVEDGLDGNEAFEIPESPFNLLEGLVVPSGFNGNGTMNKRLSR